MMGTLEGCRMIQIIDEKNEFLDWTWLSRSVCIYIYLQNQHKASHTISFFFFSSFLLHLPSSSDFFNSLSSHPFHSRHCLWLYYTQSPVCYAAYLYFAYTYTHIGDEKSERCLWFLLCSKSSMLCSIPIVLLSLYIYPY